MNKQDFLEIRAATFKMCRFGVRAASFALLVSSAAVVITTATADAATLKSAAMVSDDVVRLGDIFDNVDHPDTVLGAAPQPGKEMNLNTAVLRRVAAANAIDWQPAGSLDSITVRRETHIIDEAAISDLLTTSLTEKGLEGNFSLTLNGARDGIVLPGNLDQTVEIKSLNYTPGRDVFSAVVVAPSVENPVRTINVSGMVNRTVSVPSVSSSIRQGSVISASDIAWIDVPERMVGKDAILDADELIGKTPSRVLQIGRPVKTGEVKLPQMVARGDDVTILYVSGGMTLSAKGKSMQNGSRGDLIRITNLASAKTFSAQVTGDRVVTVQ